MLSRQPGNNNSDISTIFIIGFPDDFKERELTNMFLFAPGFEGSVLKTTNITFSGFCTPPPFTDELQHKQQLIGFVKFAKSTEAIYALDILNGRILDQERGLVLKAEIAKKNLFLKYSGSPKDRKCINFSDNENDNESINGNDRLKENENKNENENLNENEKDENFQPGVSVSSSSSNRVMNIMVPGQADPFLVSAPESAKETETHPVPNTINYKNTPPMSPPVDLISLQRNLITSPNLGSMAAIFGENFPCNTLYVGNLHPFAKEDELRSLFRNCLGYRRLSFRPKSNGPMCFVEFDDIACATVAMETLYGTMLSCSSASKGGIRLSFSKNPLGLRVASPIPPTKNHFNSTINITHSPPSTSAFMEAIGAETDNLHHQHAIATIFTHYYKINPHKSFEILKRPTPQ